MFKTLVVRSKRLSKVFLSTRGVYYQVEIKGNKINWEEPYPFAQKLPFDVDYKVIISFNEFYSVLMKFVLFRLYKENGLVFPATIKDQSEADTVLTSDNTGFLNFCAEIDGQAEDTANDLLESEELRRIQSQSHQNKNLFQNLVFFLSREINKDIFEFCIKSFYYSGSILISISID
jgi:pescadillo protein